MPLQDDVNALALEPISPVEPAEVEWDDAVWIGELRISDLTASSIALTGGQGFRRARFLIWDGDQVRGFVNVPVVDGRVDADDVRAQVAELPPVQHRSPGWELPPMSVVVCTKDHPDELRHALENICRIDYPEFEVLVVDNNPASGLTPPVVASFGDERVRSVGAVGRGLSIARNVGLKHAKYDIVAFTDDDVLVDKAWLTNLAAGFARSAGVGCVCGMAASAELITAAQGYFDKRVGWADEFDASVFALDAPPEDEPLFPLRVAAYGTGANFAVRREVMVELGGFDEGLGIGSPTGGGEDIDMFVRVLLGGHKLVREPSAVVWHCHRRTADELMIQMHNYGLGLGAWTTKLLLQPKTLRLVIGRVRTGVRHFRGVTTVEQEDGDAGPDALAGLDRREINGVLSGPWALARARLSGRASGPLKTSAAMPMSLLAFRRGQMWGDPGNTIAAGRLSLAATTFGLIGALGSIKYLPAPVLVIAVALFLFFGPGCLALSFYTNSIPMDTLLVLVPVVSVAVCILVVSGLLMAGFYSPTLILLGLAGVTAAGGLVRCSYLARQTMPATVS